MIRSPVVVGGGGGNLTTEELARAVAEGGSPTPGSAVPDTVEGVLMARIDRLPAEDKRVLQAAAVIGRSLPFLLLHLLTPMLSMREERAQGIEYGRRALELAGRTAEAIPPLEEALEREHRHWLEPFPSLWLADAYLRSGRTRDASQQADRALDLARQRGQRPAGTGSGTRVEKC